MPESKIEVRVDRDLDVAYIRLSHNTVLRTVELEDDVMVDLDEFEMVVGVEVTALDANIPFSRLADDYHVHSEVIDVLRKIQPSVAASMRLTQGADGTSRQANRAEALASTN